MSTSDAASLTATASVARWGGSNMGRFIPHAAGALAIGIILLPITEATGLIAILLIVAGGGGGLAGVLSTASVNESVEAGEQGAAIALVGVYRAGARSFTPAFISGMLLLIGIPWTLGLSGVMVLAPALWIKGTGGPPIVETPANP
jgi:hypothetical protein